MTEARSGELSSWDLLATPGEIRAASYLIGSHAHQYRLIVDVLAARQEVSLTGVGHDELAELIRARLPQETAAGLMEDLNLSDRLASLVSWGTCEAWQDRATTEEEFLRNRYRYQLTEAGAALNQVVRAIEEDLGAGSTAVLLAPAVLADRLRAALDALAGERLDDASREFSVVETTLDAMAREANQWQSRMAAALGGIPDQARITRLLETILAYVDAWGAGVDAWSGRITACLPDLKDIDPDTWRALTLQRLGAEINPETVARATNQLSGIVAVLERWFSGELPQATRLRRQMRDAVTPVLRGHRALLAIGGTVSRAAELSRLADAVARAEDDAAAWRVFATGTGLYSARHLALEAPEVPGVPSVWDAPPVPVSKRLRSQGRRSLSGRAPRVADRSRARELARANAAHEQAELQEAEHRLVSRSGTRLSDWAALTAGETRLFLDLLASAREANGMGTTADGRFTMKLTPVDPPRSAVCRTEEGRLVLADALVEFAS